MRLWELSGQMIYLPHKMALTMITSISKWRRCHRTCTRGFQKVRRPTQLTKRYVHHILSLFDIFSCNWNVLGPGFLRSSHSIVKELLFLVFQPAICRADNVLIVRNSVSFHEFIQFRKKQKSLGARTTYLITGQLKHWLSSKMPALNYSVTHRIRNLYSYCTANGRLKDQERQFFFNGIKSFGEMLYQVHFSCRRIC